MPKQILVIKHIGIEGPGSIKDFFLATAWRLITIEAGAGETLPQSPNSFEAIISLGGPMNVYEETKYPFLKDEGRLLRKAILEEMPILGICLGAQLLAKVCGAQITKAPQKEVGWGQVKLTKEGRQDSLFEGIDHELKVFQWHEDAFAIPEGGALLAENTLCPGKGKYNFLTTSKIAESHRRSRLWRIPPKAGRRFFRNQAFRFGKNAYGLQFHFEVNPGMINSWVHRYAGESLSEIDTRDMFIEAHKAEVLFQRQAQALCLNFSRIIEGARKKAAA